MAQKKPAPYTKAEVKIATVAVRIMSRLNTWIYRASGGRLGGRFLRGAPVCLLITTGRKSGQQRTAPLIYLKDGDDYIFVASKGGMPTHPDWYLNLEADPSCAIEIGSERLPAVAERVSDAEKAALWPRLLEIYPDYDDYQARTPRNIPVVRVKLR